MAEFGGFDKPLWHAWQVAEQQCATALLERAFGHIGVELASEWMPQRLLESCPVRRRLRLAANPSPESSACMELDALGIESGSVDVAILPHTLEFVASPHAVLREVHRVLAGEGHLLVTGFNPWSAWSAARWLDRSAARRARPLTMMRLCDWLQLLGFDIVARQGFFKRPPLNMAGMLERLEPMERWRHLPIPACGYAILATKHVYAPMPLRLKETQRERIGGFARPAFRVAVAQRRSNGELGN